jgi:hypothetical protein
MAFDWEKACCDCPNVWDVQYKEDGNTVANDTDRVCPECGSDNIEPLAKAQERAERAADLPFDRADYEYARRRDEGWL